MRYGFFLVFLSIAACQDLKSKEIARWVFGLFGSAAVALLFAEDSSGNSLKSALPGVLPGVFLLLCGKFTGWKIGPGDGLFFLISGLYLGIFKNLSLFLGSVFLCGIFCVVFLAWKRLCTNAPVRDETLPFLPFCAAATAMEWLIRQSV